MDLSPFYELRARLHDGAVAGALLAVDDFRLKRAAEAFLPLEKASPVFQKLGQLTRNLLEKDCPNRAGALLDALTLADAVACTQGAGTIPGKVEPFGVLHRGLAVSNAPYSVLSPLLEALTTSGGGRYSFVIEVHERNPELFQDYRVQDAMVKALGASYSELADKAEQWLSESGVNILPLLQNGFDPAGKKETVRRVRVMDAVAGAEANEFYLSALEQAEKEVRAVLLYALRHNEGNAEKLAELCKTEKGKCKTAAHCALIKLDTPATWEYFNKLAAKKPEQAAEYMVLSTYSNASKLVAKALDRALIPYEMDCDAPVEQKDMKLLQSLLSALPGKSGPDICQLYRRMAALGTALDNKSYKNTNSQTIAVRFSYNANDRDALTFSEVIPLILRQALILNPADDLLGLAEEMGQKPGFASVQLTAVLLSKPAKIAYELAEPLFSVSRLFRKKQQKENQALLLNAFKDVSRSSEQGGIVYSTFLKDPFSDSAVCFQRPLYEPLDRRWYQSLIKLDENEQLDEILSNLINPDDGEICVLIGEYLYKRALKVHTNYKYLSWLCRCNWHTCKGLLEAYCRNDGGGPQGSFYIYDYISHMPGSREEISAEIERVLELVKAKKIKMITLYESYLRNSLRRLNEIETGGTN